MQLQGCKILHSRYACLSIEQQMLEKIIISYGSSLCRTDCCVIGCLEGVIAWKLDKLKNYMTIIFGKL